MPRNRMLGVLVAAVILSAVAATAILRQDAGQPANAPRHAAGVVDPAAEIGPDVFVPASARADLSPILVAAAEWPAVAGLKSVPAAEAVPPIEVRNLRELVENWLAPALRPERFDGALGKDRQGRLFVKLRTPPGSAIAGRASCDMTPGMITFAFAIDFPNATGPVDLPGMLAQLHGVVVSAVSDELDKPEFAPHPHPALAGPEAFSAIAALDRAGCGAIHPYLYLFATPKRLLGVFQQIPHGTAPKDGK